MLQHVAGVFHHTVSTFQIGNHGTITPHYLNAFLLGSVFESLLKSIVKIFLERNVVVTFATNVLDVDRGMVFHGIVHLIGVDEVAGFLPEAFACGGFVAGRNQRRASESDSRRIGEGLEEVVAHLAALRAVRLVNKHQYL